MYFASPQEKWNDHIGDVMIAPRWERGSNDNVPAPFIECEWPALRAQLLSQWSRISEKEIDQTGQDRYRLAHLIERKYGIGFDLVENYLLNFERTLPMTNKQ